MFFENKRMSIGVFAKVLKNPTRFPRRGGKCGEEGGMVCVEGSFVHQPFGFLQFMPKQLHTLFQLYFFLSSNERETCT